MVRRIRHTLTKPYRLTIYAVAVLVCLGLANAPAQAQIVPGDACSVSGQVAKVAGTDVSGGIYVLVCNGSTWKAVKQIGTTGAKNFQVNSDSGSCTADKQGRIRYTSASDLWEYCTGSAWSAFDSASGSSDCNIVGMVPGDVCPDGTIFAGFPPDTYYPMFTTRCDPGRTYSSGCTGTRLTKPWNNGNSTGRTTTSVTDWNNGTANTATLITLDSDSGVGGTQPHQAAQYCADLVIHGHDDWYLPATNELYVMYLHESAIGDFTNAYYFASTEGSNSAARYVLMGYGSLSTDTKNTSNNLRCVRKN